MAARKKDSPPCHEMLCLGIWVNTLDMTLSVPAFRVSELQQELHAWSVKPSFTKRELQRLLGKLSYVSACVRPGRTFMSRLLNALRSCSSSPRRTIYPISDELRGCFFLSHYNGISVIPCDLIISNPEQFTTDACLTGCGAVCFGECFHREFPDFILNQGRHINELAIFKTGIGESGNRGIGESGNRGIGESGNRRIGESGNRGIGESGNLFRLSLLVPGFCDKNGSKRPFPYHILFAEIIPFKLWKAFKATDSFFFKVNAMGTLKLS